MNAMRVARGTPREDLTGNWADSETSAVNIELHSRHRDATRIPFGRTASNAGNDPATSPEPRQGNLTRLHDRNVSEASARDPERSASVLHSRVCQIARDLLLSLIRLFFGTDGACLAHMQSVRTGAGWHASSSIRRYIILCWKIASRPSRQRRHGATDWRHISKQCCQLMLGRLPRLPVRTAGQPPRPSRQLPTATQTSPNGHRKVAARRHVRTTGCGTTFAAVGRQWVATNAG
jgi:hypothetical protein